MTEVPFGEEWAGELVDEVAGFSAGTVDQGVGREADQEMWSDPADRPWTPIPHQACAMERGLIPAQRRLKKTSRSA